MDFKNNGTDPSNFYNKVKKQAKRLLKLSKESNTSVAVKNLSQAQEIIAQLNGFTDWHALERHVNSCYEDFKVPDVFWENTKDELISFNKLGIIPYEDNQDNYVSYLSLAVNYYDFYEVFYNIKKAVGFDLVDNGVDLFLCIEEKKEACPYYLFNFPTKSLSSYIKDNKTSLNEFKKLLYIKDLDGKYAPSTRFSLILKTSKKFTGSLNHHTNIVKKLIDITSLGLNAIALTEIEKKDYDIFNSFDVNLPNNYISGDFLSLITDKKKDEVRAIFTIIEKAKSYNLNLRIKYNFSDYLKNKPNNIRFVVESSDYEQLKYIADNYKENYLLNTHQSNIVPHWIDQKMEFDNSLNNGICFSNESHMNHTCKKINYKNTFISSGKKSGKTMLASLFSASKIISSPINRVTYISNLKNNNKFFEHFHKNGNLQEMSISEKNTLNPLLLPFLIKSYKPDFLSSVISLVNYYLYGSEKNMDKNKEILEHVIPKLKKIDFSDVLEDLIKISEKNNIHFDLSDKIKFIDNLYEAGFEKDAQLVHYLCSPNMKDLMNGLESISTLKDFNESNLRELRDAVKRKINKNGINCDFSQYDFFNHKRVFNAIIKDKENPYLTVFAIHLGAFFHSFLYYELVRQRKDNVYISNENIAKIEEKNIFYSNSLLVLDEVDLHGKTKEYLKSSKNIYSEFIFIENELEPYVDFIDSESVIYLKNVDSNNDFINNKIVENRLKMVTDIKNWLVLDLSVRENNLENSMEIVTLNLPNSLK